LKPVQYPDLKTLRVLRYPAPALREHAARIKEINSFLREMSDRMTELMRQEKGVGLAATQVGWPFRFVVINTTSEPGKVETFINPVIIAKRGKLFEEEGCLSVPGLFAKVRRAEIVTVRATLPTGETVEMEAQGLVARAWQHELDHLDGTLFVDRLTPTAKLIIEPKLQEMAERQASGPSSSDDQH
jgi:peptide deformylase